MSWFERPEFGANVGLIDEIYRQYLDNPDSVSPAWRDFFAENESRDDGAEETAEAGDTAEGRVKISFGSGSRTARGPPGEAVVRPSPHARPRARQRAGAQGAPSGPARCPSASSRGAGCRVMTSAVSRWVPGR